MNTSRLVLVAVNAVGLFASGAVRAQGVVPVQFLPSQHPVQAAHSAPAQSSELAQRLRDEFGSELATGRYRQMRVQLISNSSGEADHLIVYLMVDGKHRMETAKVGVDADLRFLSKQSNYRLTQDDLSQQPGTSSALATCPDASTQFIAFAPNSDTVEQQVTEQVATAAEAAGLKTVRLYTTNATRQNYLNYMVCPAIKGNFYDGDANPEEFTTVDGVISNSDVSTILKGAFRYHVTNIWLACEAYNDPMLSAVEKDAQSQKYAAGINDLSVGPSDNAGACAMEAAIQGQPMTAAFQTCYKKLDVSTDEWGFGGSGSDQFGQ